MPRLSYSSCSLPLSLPAFPVTFLPLSLPLLFFQPDTLWSWGHGQSLLCAAKGSEAFLCEECSFPCAPHCNSWTRHWYLNYCGSLLIGPFQQNPTHSSGHCHTNLPREKFGFVTVSSTQSIHHGSILERGQYNQEFVDASDMSCYPFSFLELVGNGRRESWERSYFSLHYQIQMLIEFSKKYVLLIWNWRHISLAF